jgi:hypothetical protein
MSDLEKFVKVEMIRDVPLEQIVDLMDKLEKENAEFEKTSEKVKDQVVLGKTATIVVVMLAIIGLFTLIEMIGELL